MIVSRVAVGLYVLRTGLGFLSSLISQSPLNSHISCYEIWHTSGVFFSPLPLSFQLAACKSQQTFCSASSSRRGWYPPHHSLLVVSWELAVPNIPSAASQKKGHR